MNKQFFVSGRIEYRIEHECNCDYCDIRQDDPELVIVFETVEANTPGEALRIVEEKFNDDYGDDRYNNWEWINGPTIKENNEEYFMRMNNAPTLFEV